MALRAFFVFSDKDGKDMETLAQSKKVRSTKQSSVLKSPVSARTAAFDILAISEPPATHIRNVKLHPTIIPPGYRRVLLFIGLGGYR